jgi:GNAT superfamily N-acetyltransferase
LIPRLFRIERATLDDADGILDCLRAAFEPYRTQYTAGAYEDTVMTADTVRQRIEGMTVLVARSDAGRIIGTIGGGVHGIEGHLRGMTVAPSSQGSRVASELLQAIETELTAAGCTRVTLDTTAPLVRAIRFYERNGYARSGAVSNFYGMPLHEYQKVLREMKSGSAKMRDLRPSP